MSTSRHWAGAGFWAGFHLRRNLRRRGTLLWMLGAPILAAAMRLVFDVPGDAIGQLVLVYLMPLTSLTFGGGVLREEVEDQTLTYGFSRPVDRAALYVARLVAAAGPVLIATVAAVGFAAADVGHGLRLVAAAVLGTMAHVGLFGLLGLVLRRPSWIGLVYVLVWEQTLQRFPGWLGRCTLRAHVRNLGDLDAPSSMLLASSDGPGPWWLSVLVLAGLGVVSTVAAGMLVRRRELVITR